MSLTHLPRVERLPKLDTAGKADDVMREIENNGHKLETDGIPESLLIRVERKSWSGRFRKPSLPIRKPRDSEHTVIKTLHRGRQSSIIVPIIAAALADGNSLVRIVIGRAQSK